MSKTKLGSKIICIVVLMAIALSLILCFSACTPSKNIINLENCQTQITDGELIGIDGIITDLQSVKQNKDVFSRYLKSSQGKILIPQKDEGNVLAYQVIGFSQEGVQLFPIYLFNDVDKSKIDYEELLIDDHVLLNDRQLQILTSDIESNNAISIDVTFCAYVKNYVGKLNRVATIKTKYAFYYFPIDNIYYDYFIGRYETTIIPTSKYKYECIHISSMYHYDSYIDAYRSAFYNGVEPTPKLTLETLIKYQDSYGNIRDKDMSISLDENDNMILNFDYTPYVDAMGVTNVYYAGCDARMRYDEYFADSYKVEPSQTNFDTKEHPFGKGRAYLGAYYRCYRLPTKVDTIKIAMSVDELSLSAQLGEPSFNSSFDDYFTLFLSCDRDFNNSSISMESTVRQEMLPVTSIIIL